MRRTIVTAAVIVAPVLILAALAVSGPMGCTGELPVMRTSACKDAITEEAELCKAGPVLQAQLSESLVKIELSQCKAERDQCEQTVLGQKP